VQKDASARRRGAGPYSFSVHDRVFVHPRDQREFEALVRYVM
jgi:hypothetical protein